MSEAQVIEPILLTLDMGRRRIRIHKGTLHALGNPAYIQFLVNPDALFLAILGTSKPMQGGTANKVRLNAERIQTNQSVEFYSTTLMEKLMEITGPLSEDCNYRMTGEVDRVNRVAYFSLRTLEQRKRRKQNG